MKYIVFYNNIEIGVLEINKKNQYKYTPNEKLTTEVTERIPLFHELLVQAEQGKPTPIFEIESEMLRAFLKKEKLALKLMILVDNIS